MKLTSCIAVALFPNVVSSFVVHPRVACRHAAATAGSTRVLYQPADKNAEDATAVPSFVQSPVLQQVYPKLLAWNKEYGNPNIPLGTPEGRQCKTLRRLHIQQKLLPEEVTLLQEIGFQFNDLEDVYFEADFDDMMARLQTYEATFQTNYQVPKKYPEDPELGAWVTGLRRLGKNTQDKGMDPEHVDRLNAINFTWVSSRKCGSKFMTQYRAFVERVDNEGRDAVLQEEATQKWISAQREARRRETLSDTRYHYLQELFGEDWMGQK